ncbi:MAG: isopentenyl-diphosphate Delta-isomerase [Pyrinomonadaceae bacterium]
MLEEVILVDENDRIVGKAEKIAAHLNGNLHRAFSVFVFDESGRLLVQKRAPTKYHSANLWSNTCCSHPRPGETTNEAAQRRLKEEMGFTCELKEVCNLIYKVQLDNNLFEHEFDHILVGTFDGVPQPDKSEVDDWRWIEIKNLVDEVRVYPHRYSYWLRVLIKEPALQLLPTFQDGLAFSGPHRMRDGIEAFHD